MYVLPSDNDILVSNVYFKDIYNPYKCNLLDEKELKILLQNWFFERHKKDCDFNFWAFVLMADQIPGWDTDGWMRLYNISDSY